MSGVFGGGSGPTNVAPDYTGLQIQTSVSTLPIPIVWGENKLAPNLIWYTNFQAIPQYSSSGGGGLLSEIFGGGSGPQLTGYTYTADIILALCEGPITGINQIWRGQSDYTLAQFIDDFVESEFSESSGFGAVLTTKFTTNPFATYSELLTGTTPQTTWSYLESTYPAQALAYQGTACFCAASYSLGDTGTLDNHNFEIQGFFYGTGVNGVDADPALIVNDFLTNAQYGIGFPAGSIATSTLFGSGGDSSYQTYCAAVGLALSPCLTDQETASSILDRWLKLTNTAAVWSGGQLKFIPYGDTATVAGTVETTSISEVLPPSGYFITPTPQVFVAPPSLFVADLGVKYTVSGSALTKISSGTPSAGQYLVSPAGTYVFSTADENNGITISYQYRTAASFVPNVTPLYNLNDDDFVAETNQDPLQVSVVDIYQAYNVWRLEIAERSNAYSLTTVEARDQNAIELVAAAIGGTTGMRIAPTVTAHEITDPNVALISGQLQLQRSVYIRNTYKFRLSWEYCLLDPGDLVTLTDALLGLNNTPVRIIEIEEDENGFLQVTAEEFPLGAQTATLYATQTPAGTALNRNASPGSVNAPIIFEPTDELGGGLQLWIAASGQNPALWGGCQVWASSSENGNYAQIGTITAPAIMGVTTADFPTVSVNPAGQTIDQTNTLSVNLAESDGTLVPGSQTDAVALNDACYVGGEIVSYGSATLTGANAYNLTYLVRGAFGTESAIVDHPAGTPFCFLNAALAKLPFNQNQIGSTVYLKFLSFNVWGGGLQSPADVPAYPYVIQGSALASPLPAVAGLYSNYASGFQQIFWDEVSDFRSGIVYEIRQGATWATAQVLKTQAHPPFIAQGNGTFWVSARCQPVAGLTVYSETPSSITIAGNQLSLNLLASWDEQATNWQGTFQNGIGVSGPPFGGGLADIRLGGAGNILAESILLQSTTTTAATAAGGNVLTLSSVANISAGQAVNDTTAATVIPGGTTVQSINATAKTVTLTNAVTGAGVGNGDTIVFGDPDILSSGGIVTDTPLYYTIPSTHIITSGAIVAASVNASTQIVGVPAGQNILGLTNILNYPDILGSASTQFVDGWIEINVSQDGGSTWGGWQKFIPGVYPANAWNFRLALESLAANVIPFATAFNYAVQLPARIDHYQNQSVPSGGLTITFGLDSAPSTPAPFNGGPGANSTPYVSVSWQATAGDTYQITGLSLSQLTITFYNGGVAVARSGVNIDVEGY